MVFKEIQVIQELLVQLDLQAILDLQANRVFQVQLQILEQLAQQPRSKTSAIDEKVRRQTVAISQSQGSHHPGGVDVDMPHFTIKYADTAFGCLIVKVLDELTIFDVVAIHVVGGQGAVG